MRAAVVHAPGDLRVESVPAPDLGDYDALVDILTCGVCTGTDANMLKGAFPFLPPYPFILGHESIGRVTAVGARVRYLQMGDLVLRPVAVRGGETLGGRSSGFGGYAEVGLVGDARAIAEDAPHGQSRRLPPFASSQQVVPPGFDPVDAGMFITFKETLSWFHQLGPVFGRSVLILGTGPAGLCFARIAKYLGATPVIVVGRRDERLDLAKTMGADAVINTSREDLVASARELTGGLGADYVVDAIGDSHLLSQAPRFIADGGQIAVYGVPSVQEASLAWAGVSVNWQFRLIRPREDLVHELALDLVRLGFIDLRSFVSHVVPLTNIDEAFRLVASKQALKPVIAIKDT